MQKCTMEDCSQDFPKNPTKVLHAKRRVSKSDTEGVHNVKMSASCSIQLSSKKHNKLYFLTRTLKETYVEYIKVMKKKK